MPDTDRRAFYETCCGDDEDEVSPDATKHYARRSEAARATSISRFTSEAELDQSLKPYLPSLSQALMRKIPLEDSVFPLIAEHLASHGKGEWSLRPRMYAVLKMLGRPELLDDFVKDRRYDSALPYTQGNLPDAVRGLELRSKFMRLQALVACQESDISALEEGGKHLHLDKPAKEYLIPGTPLGIGRKGTSVDLVTSRRTARRFARKWLKRGLSAPADAKILEDFEREVQNLKRLCHNHIVKLVGSYTDSNDVGLIMTPVADCNLGEFLADAKMDAVVRKRRLRPFFGCLATALAYLHRKEVRHNDIKPQNILVKDFGVYLADFGISRSWNENMHSTTVGNHEGFTKRYCPPELVHGENIRNTASDVWSLGCVFLEMATVLADRSPDDLLNFFRTHGRRRNDYFALNSEAMNLWIREIRSKLRDQDSKTMNWVEWMLQDAMNDRPSPMQLRGKIIDDSEEERYICDRCSSPEGLDDEKSVKEISEQLAPVSASDLGRPERQPDTHSQASAENPHESGPLIIAQNGSVRGSRRSSLFTENEQGTFINPSPVTAPPFLKKDSLPLPTATLVPSYILAGTNHFSNTEFEDVQRYNPLAVNLFVYGRLMFPSILHSIAAASTDGVYVPKLHRRLYPSTGDWARADVSIKCASDNMTPARLNGYDRWRPRGLNCAVAQDARLTKQILEQREKIKRHPPGTATLEPPGRITGFLIVGLRADALRYCDFLFTSDDHTLWCMTPPTDDDDADRNDSSQPLGTQPRPLLQRQTVKVEVELDDGIIKTVDADTYVWTQGTNDIVDIWDEDRFVRSKSMQKLLSSRPNWTAEEQQLAFNMNMALALVGDYLCSAIMSGDIQALAGLLDDQHFSPDSPCRLYGLPLQAAVVAGRDDMVRLLISQKAQLDTVGGLYGTPLITAAIYGRIAIAKTLLHHGADVLASDRVHVSALYQAVFHVHYALVDMLLEHGAWLSPNWMEILDLADGLGADGSDIRMLLSKYDVRGRTSRSRRSRELERIWEGRRRGRLREGQISRREPGWNMVNYSRVGSAVLRRLGSVYKMPYNWKGRKAVELTVAALDAGAPLELVNLIRQAIHPVQAIMEILRKSDERHGHGDSPLGYLHETEDVGEVSEGSSGSDRDSPQRSHRRDASHERQPAVSRASGDGATDILTRASELRLPHSQPPPRFRRPSPSVSEGRGSAGRWTSSRTASPSRRDTTHLTVPEPEWSTQDGQLRRSASAAASTSSRYGEEYRSARSSRGDTTSAPRRRDSTYLTVPESEWPSREGGLRRSVSARSSTHARRGYERRSRRD